jgi:hypothetical protein
LVRLRYVIVRPPQATGIFIADFVAISHRKYMIYVYIYNIDNYWYIGIYIYVDRPVLAPSLKHCFWWSWMKSTRLDGQNHATYTAPRRSQE